MRKPKKLFLIIFFLLLSSIIALVGCQQLGKPSSEEEPQETSPKQNPPPSSLENLQEGSEEIIKSLEKIDKDTLKNANKKISALQGKWNSFWPKAKKAGAREELKKQFESTLDHLTSMLSKTEPSQIDKDQVMHAAVLLTKPLPDFMDLYKSEIPTDIYRLRFLSRDLYAYTVENNWQMAMEDMKQILIVWKNFHSVLSKKDKDLASEMDYSIEQLTNVVSQNNSDLTKVKVKDVVLKILDKCEKKYEQ